MTRSQLANDTREWLEELKPSNRIFLLPTFRARIIACIRGGMVMILVLILIFVPSIHAKLMSGTALTPIFANHALQQTVGASIRESTVLLIWTVVWTAYALAVISMFSPVDDRTTEEILAHSDLLILFLSLGSVFVAVFLVCYNSFEYTPKKLGLLTAVIPILAWYRLSEDDSIDMALLTLGCSVIGAVIGFVITILPFPTVPTAAVETMLRLHNTVGALRARMGALTIAFSHQPANTHDPYLNEHPNLNLDWEKMASTMAESKSVTHPHPHAGFRKRGEPPASEHTGGVSPQASVVNAGVRQSLIAELAAHAQRQEKQVDSQNQAHQYPEGRPRSGSGIRSRNPLPEDDTSVRHPLHPDIPFRQRSGSFSTMSGRHVTPLSSPVSVRSPPIAPPRALSPRLRAAALAHNHALSTELEALAAKVRRGPQSVRSGFSAVGRSRSETDGGSTVDFRGPNPLELLETLEGIVCAAKTDRTAAEGGPSAQVASAGGGMVTGKDPTQNISSSKMPLRPVGTSDSNLPADVPSLSSTVSAFPPGISRVATNIPAGTGIDARPRASPYIRPRAWSSSGVTAPATEASLGATPGPGVSGVAAGVGPLAEKPSVPQLERGRLIRRPTLLDDELEMEDTGAMRATARLRCQVSQRSAFSPLVRNRSYSAQSGSEMESPLLDGIGPENTSRNLSGTHSQVQSDLELPPPLHRQGGATGSDVPKSVEYGASYPGEKRGHHKGMAGQGRSSVPDITRRNDRNGPSTKERVPLLRADIQDLEDAESANVARLLRASRFLNWEPVLWWDRRGWLLLRVRTWISACLVAFWTCLVIRSGDSPLRRKVKNFVRMPFVPLLPPVGSYSPADVSHLLRSGAFPAFDIGRHSEEEHAAVFEIHLQSSSDDKGEDPSRKGMAPVEREETKVHDIRTGLPPFNDVAKVHVPHHVSILADPEKEQSVNHSGHDIEVAVEVPSPLTHESAKISVEVPDFSEEEPPVLGIPTNPSPPSDTPSGEGGTPSSVSLLEDVVFVEDSVNNRVFLYMLAWHQHTRALYREAPLRLAESFEERAKVWLAATTRLQQQLAVMSTAERQIRSSPFHAFFLKYLTNSACGLVSAAGTYAQLGVRQGVQADMFSFPIGFQKPWLERLGLRLGFRRGRAIALGRLPRLFIGVPTAGIHLAHIVQHADGTEDIFESRARMEAYLSGMGLDRNGKVPVPSVDTDDTSSDSDDDEEDGLVVDSAPTSTSEEQSWWHPILDVLCCGSTRRRAWLRRRARNARVKQRRALRKQQEAQEAKERRAREKNVTYDVFADHIPMPLELGQARELVEAYLAALLDDYQNARNKLFGLSSLNIVKEEVGLDRLHPGASTTKSESVPVVDPSGNRPMWQKLHEMRADDNELMELFEWHVCDMFSINAFVFSLLRAVQIIIDATDRTCVHFHSASTPTDSTTDPNNAAAGEKAPEPGSGGIDLNEKTGVWRGNGPGSVAISQNSAFFNPTSSSLPSAPSAPGMSTDSGQVAVPPAPADPEAVVPAPPRWEALASVGSLAVSPTASLATIMSGDASSHASDKDGSFPMSAVSSVSGSTAGFISQGTSSVGTHGVGMRQSVSLPDLQGLTNMQATSRISVGSSRTRRFHPNSESLANSTSPVDPTSILLSPRAPSASIRRALENRNHSMNNSNSSSVAPVTHRAQSMPPVATTTVTTEQSDLTEGKLGQDLESELDDYERRVLPRGGFTVHAPRTFARSPLVLGPLVHGRRLTMSQPPRDPLLSVTEKSRHSTSGTSSALSAGVRAPESAGKVIRAGSLTMPALNAGARSILPSTFVSPVQIPFTSNLENVTPSTPSQPKPTLASLPPAAAGKAPAVLDATASPPKAKHPPGYLDKKIHAIPMIRHTLLSDSLSSRGSSTRAGSRHLRRRASIQDPYSIRRSSSIHILNELDSRVFAAALSTGTLNTDLVPPSNHREPANRRTIAMYIRRALLYAGVIPFTTDRFLRSLKSALAVTLASGVPNALNVFLGNARHYWAGVAAVLLLGAEGGAYKVSAMRLNGTLIGSIFGYIFVVLAWSDLVLAVFAVLGASALQYPRETDGARMLIIYMSGSIVMLGLGPESATSEELALGRIKQTVLGIVVFLLVFNIIFPASARLLLRRRVGVVLQEIRVGTLATVFEFCRFIYVESKTFKASHKQSQHSWKSYDSGSKEEVSRGRKLRRKGSARSQKAHRERSPDIHKHPYLYRGSRFALPEGTTLAVPPSTEIVGEESVANDLSRIDTSLMYEEEKQTVEQANEQQRQKILNPHSNSPSQDSVGTSKPSRGASGTTRQRQSTDHPRRSPGASTVRRSYSRSISSSLNFSTPLPSSHIDLDSEGENGKQASRIRLDRSHAKDPVLSLARAEALLNGVPTLLEEAEYEPTLWQVPFGPTATRYRELFTTLSRAIRAVRVVATCTASMRAEIEAQYAFKRALNQARRAVFLSPRPDHPSHEAERKRINQVFVTEGGSTISRTIEGVDLHSPDYHMTYTEGPTSTVGRHLPPHVFSSKPPASTVGVDGQKGAPGQTPGQQQQAAGTSVLGASHPAHFHQQFQTSGNQQSPLQFTHIRVLLDNSMYLSGLPLSSFLVDAGRPRAKPAPPHPTAPTERNATDLNQMPLGPAQQAQTRYDKHYYVPGGAAGSEAPPDAMAAPQLTRSILQQRKMESTNPFFSQNEDVFHHMHGIPTMTGGGFEVSPQPSEVGKASLTSQEYYTDKNAGGVLGGPPGTDSTISTTVDATRNHSQNEGSNQRLIISVQAGDRVSTAKLDPSRARAHSTGWGLSIFSLLIPLLEHLFSGVGDTLSLIFLIMQGVNHVRIELPEEWAPNNEALSESSVTEEEDEAAPLVDARESSKQHLSPQGVRRRRAALGEEGKRAKGSVDENPHSYRARRFLRFSVLPQDEAVTELEGKEVVRPVAPSVRFESPRSENSPRPANAPTRAGTSKQSGLSARSLRSSLKRRVNSPPRQPRNASGTDADNESGAERDPESEVESDHGTVRISGQYERSSGSKSGDKSSSAGRSRQYILGASAEEAPSPFSAVLDEGRASTTVALTVERDIVVDEGIVRDMSAASRLAAGGEQALGTVTIDNVDLPGKRLLPRGLTDWWRKTWFYTRWKDNSLVVFCCGRRSSGSAREEQTVRGSSRVMYALEPKEGPNVAAVLFDAAGGVDDHDEARLRRWISATGGWFSSKIDGFVRWERRVISRLKHPRNIFVPPEVNLLANRRSSPSAVNRPAHQRALTSGDIEVVVDQPPHVDSNTIREDMSAKEKKRKRKEKRRARRRLKQSLAPNEEDPRALLPLVVEALLIDLEEFINEYNILLHGSLRARLQNASTRSEEFYLEAETEAVFGELRQALGGLGGEADVEEATDKVVRRLMKLLARRKIATITSVDALSFNTASFALVDLTEATIEIARIGRRIAYAEFPGT